MRTPVLPHVARLWTPPPCSGGLRCFPHVTRLWVLSPYSGGLQRYHVSHGSGPYLPAPGGSDAVTCPVTLMRSHALRINKDLAVTTCNKTHVFLRHACTLLRHLQDARADDIIITCKPCGHALQYHATVQRHTTDCSRARLAEAMTRQDGATLQTTHHMARPIIPDIATPLKTSLIFLAISALLYRVLSASGPHIGPRVSL
jgi:RNase P subunit RPR2